jgi:hypothetical protein
MKIIRTSLFILGFCALVTASAHAQATRTWVSGVGDDANPCSRTAPCKTFAGAISKTAAGGEIDAMDPSGYGALTITKAITIDGGEGQVSSVLVSGTSGITISAGLTDVVNLRNLEFNGIGSGLNGINFVTGGVLHVEHCSIFGFTLHGINVSPMSAASVSIIDTTIVNNLENGVNVVGGARIYVTIDRSRFENNHGSGVFAGDFSRVTVRDSDASENNVGFLAQANGGDVIINIANSTAGNNTTTGIQAGGGSAASYVRLSGVSIFSNGVNGLVTGTNGSILSFGNNYNSGSGVPTSLLGPQ